MPRKIETAYVEYLPDLRNFEREATRQLTRSLNAVERTVNDSVHDVERMYDRLADDLDLSFDEMERAGTTSFEVIDSAATDTANDIGREFQQAGERAEDAFTELSRTADRQLDRIDRDVRETTDSTRRRFSGLGLVGGAALLGVGAAATAGLGALATMGLSSAAALEQTQISFNALLGSAEEGLRVFKSLQAFAAVTPFEFPEVAAAAKRFLAFNEAIGMTDGQLEQFLTTVGDIASLTGTGAEGLNRVTFALGQIGSRGRVALEEINQISEAIPGFSALGAIAKEFGVTTAEAMDMISAGEVDAVRGVQAILEGMREFPGAAGAMAMQAETLQGVFSTFKDVVGQSLAEAFAPVIPVIKDALKQITPIIGDALGEIAPALGGLIAALLPIVSDLIQAIVPIITPLLDALGPALAPLGPVLVPIGEALGEIIVALAPILPLLGQFIVAVLQLALPILNLLVPAFELLTPILEFATDAIAEFNKWLGGVDWGDVGSDIAGGFSDAWTAVSDFFVGIGEWFADLPGEIIDFVKSLPGRFVDLLESMLELGLEAIGVGIGLILALIIRFPGMALNALVTLGPMLGEFFVQLGLDVFMWTVDMWTKVIDFFISVPGKIGDALAALPGVIAKWFTTVRDRAVKIVSGLITTVVTFFRNLPEKLRGFASDVGNGIVNFIKSFLNRAIDGINRGIAKVDEWVPGDLPRLPRLARGGVAFGPSIIGEDARTGPEAAIPLGDQRALSMLREALGTGGDTITFAPGAIVVNVSGATTPAEAEAIGRGVGNGISETLANRNGIRTAVRMA